MTRIHHVIASINVEIGGPAVSVTRLHNHLTTTGVDSTIHSIDYRRHGALADKRCGPFPTAGLLTRITRGWNQEFRKRLREGMCEFPGLVHNHGCWMSPNREARLVSVRAKCPLLISPRGMLEPWALQYQSTKKKLAWVLFENNNCQAARAFHATSYQEAQSIRALGMNQPIYIVPNGVDPPDPDSIYLKDPSIPEGPFILFLSRLHRKKGLELLLSCWDQLQSRFPDWRLIIAGPDLDGYRAELSSRLGKAIDDPSILWAGPVQQPLKSALLARAACLCLPSYSENFGHVIPEALIHGTPVITTDQTPWTELNRRGCGWVIPPNLPRLMDSLEEVMQTPTSQLSLMGEQGAAWIRSDFSWNSIAKSMAEVYNHLLGCGPKPNFILEV
jgi:glycosyltransferase involved in cell wall biosynthesis